MHKVEDIRVAFVAGLDLVGWDEERLLACAIAAVGGISVGLWVSSLLGLRG